MNILDQIIGLLAPHRCLSCGSTGSMLCSDCRAQYVATPPSRCYRCHAKTSFWSVCTKCRTASPLSHVIISTEYDPLIKQLIHLYKFERAIAASQTIAALLSEFDDTPFDMIVPIPTASRRIRIRGYDHILLIAKQVSQSHKLPLVPALQRITNSRQVGSTRIQRLAQADTAYRFHSKYRARVRGRHILLIDDLVTTGATLESAARILKSAGAKHVSALVLTQKQ